MGAIQQKTGLFQSTNDAGLLWCAFDNGYPVLPVKPGKKAPAINEWQQFNTRRPTADELREWSTKFPGHSIGIAAASELGFIALDCDVLEDQESRECWKALVRILGGHKPPTRVGQAPKWLALVGTAGKRIATRKPHPIEVFGHTGQFVAFGIHEKTGKPYNWFQGSPIITPIDELPVITETKLNHWLMECAKITGKDQTGSASPVAPGQSSLNVNQGNGTALGAERSGLRGKDYGEKILEQLSRLGPNNKSDILISVVSSLVLRKFTDDQIITICTKPYLEPWEGVEEHGIEFLKRMIKRTRRNLPRWSSNA